MIIDTSALIAVLLKEDDEELFARTMLATPELKMSAVNFFETAIVVDRRPHPAAAYIFEDYVRFLRIEVVPVTEDHAYLARRAYREFGKGLHRASLNFGDCFAYALAKQNGEPLLFKGNDFARTDIEPALKT